MHHLALCFPIYCLKNCVHLYSVSLFLHRSGNILAYVAALFVAIVSMARGADGRTGDCKSPGHRSESATAKVVEFQSFC